ncbi:MAG: hypothetical protein KR126chlam3_00345 [Chlamydiae bacterium]|nr:hypothetical protein [Chlamydiota bacterium]
MASVASSVDKLLGMDSPISSFENIETLNPVQRFQMISKAVKQTFTEKDIDRSSLVPTKKESERSDPFQIEEDSRFRTISIFGTTATAGAAVHESRRYFSEAISDFRSSVTDKVSKKSFNQFRGVIEGVAFGGAIYLATALYQKLAKEIRQEILTVFRNISNDEITRDELSTSVDEVFEKKAGSIFSSIFEYFNPVPMGYLLLTKGIVLDSNGKFHDAQNKYQKALQLSANDNNLNDLIRYALARSILLSRTEAVNEADRKYFAKLLNTDELIFQGKYGEVFFEDTHIPADFVCPITFEVMQNPVYYERDGHRYYFEKAAITKWLDQENSCPITRASLNRDALCDDNDLEYLIRIWNQVKIKIDADYSKGMEL